MLAIINPQALTGLIEMIADGNGSDLVLKIQPIKAVKARPPTSDAAIIEPLRAA